MKKLFLVCNLLIINQLAFSQGIIWEQSIEAAFQKAKATNKAVFVECYHPTCPICMSLEPTLKSAEVGKFYNQNFVNFKLNLSDANHVKFLDGKKIRLPSFPMFLYFDKDRNLIHQTETDNTKEAFIQRGQTALNPEKRATSYKKRYENGERSSDFLVSYAYFSRIIGDTAANYVTANEVYKAFPKDQLSNATSWAITKKIVTDVENGFAKFWFNNVATAKQYEASGGHPDGENNVLGTIIQSSLFGLRGQSYNLAQVNYIKDCMGKVGAGQYAAGMTWQHEARAYFRTNQAEKAVAVVENMSKQFANNGQALVYLVTFCNETAKDGSYKTAATNWLAKAKTLLKEPKDLAEMHYETAKMFQKTGDKSTAQKEASEAHKAATLAKIDLKKFNELNEKMK